MSSRDRVWWLAATEAAYHRHLAAGYPARRLWRVGCPPVPADATRQRTHPIWLDARSRYRLSTQAQGHVRATAGHRSLRLASLVAPFRFPPEPRGDGIRLSRVVPRLPICWLVSHHVRPVAPLTRQHELSQAVTLNADLTVQAERRRGVRPRNNERF